MKVILCNQNLLSTVVEWTIVVFLFTQIFMYALYKMINPIIIDVFTVSSLSDEDEDEDLESWVSLIEDCAPEACVLPYLKSRVKKPCEYL